MSDKNIFLEKFIDESSDFQLNNDSRIAVIGGGPAGTFFCSSFIDLANRVGLNVQIDLYEAQDFSRKGPAGCNHCGGIISESLVQVLAAEGIIIPRSIIQKGIDSYVLHTDVGTERIKTPLLEKRIAAVYRGSGPLNNEKDDIVGFDAHMLKSVVDKGVNLINERVISCDFKNEYPVIATQQGRSENYDLVVGSTGVNSSGMKVFENLGIKYKSPKITKTFISEFHLGKETIEKYFGNSMHVFLLNVKRLKFAALIPKGPYVTFCMMGENIDRNFVQSFLNTEEVKKCFPPGIELSEYQQCQCFPKMNIRGAVQPYNDRVVLIGDAAVTRLYKDGIGAAYSTAKAAANTVVLYGISSSHFKKYYWPTCKSINQDNSIGKIIFLVTNLIQKTKFSKRGILRLIKKEQANEKLQNRLSNVLWNTFTGSSPYKDIFKSTLNPKFLSRLAFEFVGGIFGNNNIMR